MVKNLPAMWEMQVRSLGLEDSLEKGTATHCSILVWRIPWTEESSGLQSMGITKSQTRLSAGTLVFTCKSARGTCCMVLGAQLDALL